MFNGSPHGSEDKESTCNAGDLHQDSIDQGLAPSIGFRCWLKVQVVTCFSDLLYINQKFSIYKLEPRETWVWFLGWEVPLEKGTATHSSIVAWRIPWTEEPLAGYNPWGRRFRCDWATFPSLHFIMHTPLEIHCAPESIIVQRWTWKDLWGLFGFTGPNFNVWSGSPHWQTVFAIPTGCLTIQIILALPTWKQHQIP